MPEPRPLSRAPITEAVIDVRIKPAPGLGLQNVESVVESLSDDYSQREELRMREFLLEFGEDAEKVESRRQGPLGFRIATPTRSRVVQLKLNGFTYSWLKPYSSWEDLSEAARGVWEIYSGIVVPNRIIRVAVRYINHIPLPLPIAELRDFLPATPDLPKEWPQMMSGYLSRIGVMDEATGNQSIVTQTSEQAAERGVVNFLLDIDCFNSNPPQESDGMWELLEDLRRLKNRIFFSSVTDRLLERFE